MGSYKKQKLDWGANDGWGESSSETKKNDDGWGAPSSGANDGWGDSSSKPKKNDDGWGASSSGANDDWGDSSSKTEKNNDGWGANSSRPNNGRGGNFSKPKRNDDGWGGTASRTNDSWGDGPSKQKKNDDGWGAPSSSAKDNWGDSSSKPRKNDDGWGATSSGADDAWGAGSSGAATGDGEPRRKPREQRSEGDDANNDRPAPYRPEEIDLDEEAKYDGTGEGECFEQYCDQVVTCMPAGVVKPIETFSDIISSDLLLGHLEKNNYKRMTAIQKWAMPALREGYDIIGCAQTGSGKTAAFVLPVIQTLLIDSKNSELPNNANQDIQEPSCLIIAPTRELAIQLNNETLKWSRDSVVKSVCIYGGVSTGHLKAKITQGCHILVSTPGRLKDFVNRNWIKFKNIKFIILDEGDRLIDEGFINDIREILNHESMPPQEKRQILFFSATFKAETQKVARELMKQKFVFITVGRVGSANSNIKQEFVQVTRAEKKRELQKILKEVPSDQKTIIFTQTKAAADMLAGYFTALNLGATSIHGDRLQQQREEAIRQFKRGERRFLISSPVGNRGLDLPKVYLVINYDLPNNIDEYVHRIGRTGRAGHLGRAISFYDQDKDTEILPDLISLLKEVGQEIPAFFNSASSETQPVGDAANDGGWGDTGPAQNNTTADEEW